MHIEFELHPIDDIAPWGDEKNPTLSWFGLTDGLYRIRVESDYLLSYTEAVRAPFARECPGAYSGHCVDYYVVRLWEDLIEMLPYVLEPVPKEFVHYLDRDCTAINAYWERAHEWWDAQDDAGAPRDHTAATVDAATLWLGNRFLDNGYLSTPARIWMWSQDDVIRIVWDNRDIAMEGKPVWSAQRGSCTLSRTAFLEAIKEFDRTLIGRMAERVDQVCRYWSRPEIQIDLDALKRNQRERAVRLQQQLDQCEFYVTDWDAASAAMKTIQSA